MRRRNQVPGCIFINHGRYWWRVKLPGEKQLKARPLIPDGGAFATDDPGVAEQVARDMYARAVFAAGATEASRRPRTWSKRLASAASRLPRLSRRHWTRRRKRPSRSGRSASG